MRKLIVFPALFTVCLSSHGADNCDWDADQADSPDFANKLGKCEPDNKASKLLDVFKRSTDGTEPGIVQTWGDGNADSDTGLSEVPIPSASFSQHKPGQRYAVREGYSLRLGARFEESVTLAIHRLHEKMAAYCSQGWVLDRQWSSPADEPGYYYLHYNISCSTPAQSSEGK